MDLDRNVSLAVIWRCELKPPTTHEIPFLFFQNSSRERLLMPDEKSPSSSSIPSPLPKPYPQPSPLLKNCFTIPFPYTPMEKMLAVR